MQLDEALMQQIKHNEYMVRLGVIEQIKSIYICPKKQLVGFYLRWNVGKPIVGAD